jgi:hypothetical protein
MADWFSPFYYISGFVAVVYLFGIFPLSRYNLISAGVGFLVGVAIAQIVIALIERWLG